MPNFIIFFILALREFLCSLFEMWNRRAEFLGHLFFFGRGKTRNQGGHFLFSTIAYQLALNVHGLRQHINRIMKLNPTRGNTSSNFIYKVDARKRIDNKGL